MSVIDRTHVPYPELGKEKSQKKAKHVRGPNENAERVIFVRDENLSQTEEAQEKRRLRKAEKESQEDPAPDNDSVVTDKQESQNN